MGKVPQFYGGAGVPLRVEGGVESPAIAWRSQRARLRCWLDALPDAEWTGPTRCHLWNTTLLVRHLVSATQFLSYTLHQAVEGETTGLLRDFDVHETVQAAAAMLGDMTPRDERSALASADAAVEVELVRLDAVDWAAHAEAPPGELPAHLVMSHFLFDSWVHEYDLMLPRGEQPPIDRLEAQVVVGYLIGLAAIATGARTPLALRLTNPDLLIGLDIDDGIIDVTVGSAPTGAAAIEGCVVDFVDRTTGRPAGAVQGDERALAVVDGLARLLAP